MIAELQFYLSDENNMDRALKLSSLTQDELELIVGRFNSNSHRKGKLRGELVVFIDGTIVIRHHFNKKVLWRSN